MIFDNDWEPENKKSPDFWDPNWNRNQQRIRLTFDMLIHPSDKAYLLQFGKRDIWLPKSETVINTSKNIIIVPIWLVYQNSLEKYSIDRKYVNSSKEKIILY